MHMFAKKQLMQHHKIDKLTAVPFFKFSFTLPIIKPFALFLRTNKIFHMHPINFCGLLFRGLLKLRTRIGFRRILPWLLYHALR